MDTGGSKRETANVVVRCGGVGCVGTEGVKAGGEVVLREGTGLVVVVIIIIIVIISPYPLLLVFFVKFHENKLLEK